MLHPREGQPVCLKKRKKRKKELHFVVNPLVPPPAKPCAFGAKFLSGRGTKIKHLSIPLQTLNTLSAVYQ